MRLGFLKGQLQGAQVALGLHKHQRSRVDHCCGCARAGYTNGLGLCRNSCLNLRHLSSVSVDPRQPRALRHRIESFNRQLEALHFGQSRGALGSGCFGRSSRPVGKCPRCDDCCCHCRCGRQCCGGCLRCGRWRQRQRCRDCSVREVRTHHWAFFPARVLPRRCCPFKRASGGTRRAGLAGLRTHVGCRSACSKALQSLLCFSRRCIVAGNLVRAISPFAARRTFAAFAAIAVTGSLFARLAVLGIAASRHCHCR